MPAKSTSFARSKTGFVLAGGGTGLKVSPSSGMTVSIAAGFYFLGGKQFTYGGGTKTIDTADATNARYDVVCAGEDSTITVVKGTAAASPVVPTVRDDLLPLAVITVTAADSTIASGDITDIRDFGGLTADGTTISISAGGVLSVNQSGLSNFPTVLASGQGNTSIVGNGANQTVFTDSFTAPSNGDLIVVFMKQSFTRTAGAGAGTSYTPKLGSTNLLSQAFTDGNFRVQECRSAAGSGNRGYFLVKEIQDGSTGAAAETVITNTTNSYTALPTTVSLDANVPAGTTYNIEYTYHVIKFAGGV